jgi:hypothetical protein
VTAPYISRVLGGVLVATRIPSGGFHISIRDYESAQLTLAIPPEDAARLRAWLAAPADDDKPAVPEPLPAWRPYSEYGHGAAFIRALPSDIGGKNALAAAFSPGSARLWLHPGALSMHGSKESTPSIWHAMHAADKALMDAGHTLTDPAPAPPDLRGVTFGAWGKTGLGTVRIGDGGVAGVAVLCSTRGLMCCSVPYPTITTREQADAFLRACGATLEDA